MIADSVALTLHRSGTKDLLRRAYLQFRGSTPLQGGRDRRLKTGRILTCDAFDTLITRPLFHPVDVFLLCGLELRRRGIIQVSEAVWQAARQRAEHEVAAWIHPVEVTLDEIYDRLVSLGILPARWVVDAASIERDIELMLTRPIAQMVDAVRSFVSQGGQVCVLSDTYLPQADVRRMLAKSGLVLDEAAVLTSAEAGCTKRHGGLFEVGLQRLGIPGDRALHVGDNVRSDVARARAAGLSAAPFLAGGATHFERGLYDSLGGRGILASVIAGAARAVRLGRSFDDVHRQVIWNTSANLSGPLLFSYVVWVLREARRSRLSRLYFLSRDGEILLRIAREIQPVLAPQIECRYLLASRRSLHLPAVLDWGDVERSWVLDAADRHSLKWFATKLDIPLATLWQLLPPGSPLRETDADSVLGLEGSSLLAAVVDQPAVQRVVLERAAERREDCLHYLAQEQMLAPGNVGVVDIGWRGRLQRSLCRLLESRDPHFRHRLFGYYIDLEEQPEEAGVLTSMNTICNQRDFSWSKRGALFEIFCAAQHGTVLRYQTTRQGTAAAELASLSNPDAEHWGLSVQQDGIVSFVREVMSILGKAGIDPSEHVEALAQAAQSLTRLFVEKPTRAEAATYGCFPHAEDEAHTKLEEIGALFSIDPRSIWRQIRAPSGHRRISHWPEASVVRTVPSLLRGPALRALRHMPGRRI